MRPSTYRFLARFARPGPAPAERELLLRVDGEPRPASVVLPERADASGVAWVLLHGITVPGRHHTGLRRMANALAAAGHLVLVPEVPAWRALDPRPEVAEPALRGAVEFLRRWPGVDAERIGVMGFSISATWGLEVAAGPMRGAFRGAVAAGAYADLERLVRGMVVGEHDWRGETEQYVPDPYGRWILGGALLPLLEGDEWGPPDARRQAGEALRRLARTAGRHGAMSDQPVYDPLIAGLRQTLPAEAHRAWDLLAPQSARLVPDPASGRRLAVALAEAGRRSNPMHEPRGHLDGLSGAVVMLHGRYDRLVPYSETLRLAELLPPGVRQHITVTRLLGHTKRSEAGPARNPLALGVEIRRFVAFADAMLGAVEG